MAHPRSRLPDIENERIIEETLRRVRLGLANGTLGVSTGGGGNPGGGGGPGTLESLTDVDILTPADGDIIYRSGSKWIALAIPADWATQRYVLSIADGFPAWTKATGVALDAGWGFDWGNNWGGT